MKIEHVAIWTYQLEELKEFYCTWFAGVANEKYHNNKTGFQSYFLKFKSGSRLELMQMEGITDKSKATSESQHLGLIHLAFGVDTMAEVDRLAIRMEQAGFSILRGPRKTGDGYYEFETLDPDNNRLEITTLFR